MKWYKVEVRFNAGEVLAIAILWGITAVCNIIALFK